MTDKILTNRVEIFKVLLPWKLYATNGSLASSALGITPLITANAFFSAELRI